MAAQAPPAVEAHPPVRTDVPVGIVAGNTSQLVGAARALIALAQIHLLDVVDGPPRVLCFAGQHENGQERLQRHAGAVVVQVPAMPDDALFSAQMTLTANRFAQLRIQVLQLARMNDSRIDESVE
jgi:hypothetical protein